MRQRVEKQECRPERETSQSKGWEAESGRGNSESWKKILLRVMDETELKDSSDTGSKEGEPGRTDAGAWAAGTGR